MNKKTDVAETESMYRGKIGRLPRSIREDLSQRMEEGYATRELLVWLNDLPEVNWCLVEYFDGLDINAQNLSNWRRGGHQQWLKHEERRALVRELAGNAQELAADAGGAGTGDHLSAMLMAEFAVAAQETLATLTDPAERCQRLEGLLGTLTRVRRQDCAAGRLAIEQARRAREVRAEKEDDLFKEQCAKDWVKMAAMFQAGRVEEGKAPSAKDTGGQPTGGGSQEANAGNKDIKDERDEKKGRVEASQPESRLIKANQGSLRMDTMGEAPRINSQPSAFAKLRRDRPEKLQTPITKAVLPDGHSGESSKIQAPSTRETTKATKIEDEDENEEEQSKPVELSEIELENAKWRAEHGF